MIAIIDYGMGNIHSVHKAMQRFGAEVCVTSKLDDIRKADKLVLPGVGAFDDAMEELNKTGLAQVIKEEVKAGKPLLGICLGMQLMFEESEEAKKTKGLGILKGRVKRFSPKEGLKVPHMGWNQLKVNPDCPLLKSIKDSTYVYFCHSYYPTPSEKAVVAATTDYGGDFASAVRKDNVYGAQFHPEKSQRAGLQMIENFVKLC